MKNIFKKIYMILTLSLIFTAKINALTIVLDPGHSVEDPGAVRIYNEKEVKERDLNLKIVKFMQEEFKKYKTSDGEEVTIVLTWGDADIVSDSLQDKEEMLKVREKAVTYPSLEERIKIGVKAKADAVISIHNNASKVESRKGAMVLVTDLESSPLYKKEEAIGLSILSELKKLGISIWENAESEKTFYDNCKKGNRVQASMRDGLARRLSNDGTTYSDGSITDHYDIIMYGIKNNMLSVIVENCYLSNADDYENFLSTDEKLEEIAKADVRGIANYFKLSCDTSK